MSLKSFFKRVLASIKKAFESLAPEFKQAVHIGVLVVDNMKKFVESPAADVITALIPGTVDDLVKERLRQFLPKIMIEMKLAEQCAGLTDPNEIVACAVKTLQQIGDDWIANSAKKNFYNSIAVLIGEVASDGKLTWDDMQWITKWFNDNVKKAA
ncbi:MAG: hypothetical protein V4615_04930 [Bacteroidota bacterium]